MPADSQAFVSEWKGKSLDGTRLVVFLGLYFKAFRGSGLVEQVRDGTTLRVRLFMPDGAHQMVNITLAGVKSPRVASKQGESSEPWGEEVSSFRIKGMTLIYQFPGQILYGITFVATARKGRHFVTAKCDYNPIPVWQHDGYRFHRYRFVPTCCN